MPGPTDLEQLARELRLFLGSGPRKAPDAVRHLGISQPTFSRLIGRYRDDFLITGRARATEYLAYREIVGVGRKLAIYEIADDGRSREIAVLHAVRANAFFVEPRVADVEGGYFPDLPYFLHELRPSGFLGRLIPRRHPELQLPGDISVWSADHVLTYVSRLGWNLPGALIVGDEAFRLHLLHAGAPADMIADQDRATEYPRLADNLLAAGAPGSSAGGEQPKFLVTRSPSGTSVLVKFSPPVRDATSARIADLLIAEKVCLDVMQARGHAASRAEILHAGERVFLEVERFDRLPGGGRRNVLSMFALDAQFVGSLRSWDVSASELIRRGRIPASVGPEIHWRQLFGRLIANTDMHPRNLAFFVRGSRVLGLAPAYDMAPALYAPLLGHLREPAFEVPVPSPADALHWEDACTAAEEVWMRVAHDERVSEPFRTIARANARSVEQARRMGRLLPHG